MRLRAKLKKWVYGACPGIAGAFPYFGTKVHFPKGSVLFHRACVEGIYEAATVDLITRLVRPESFYFDVGANIGLLSVPILRTVPRSFVISFEPSPNAAEWLQRTRDRSPWTERWRIVQKAVGDRVGKLQFFVNSQEMGAFDGLKDTKRGGGRSEPTVVAATTLDEEWHTLKQPPVSVVKVDVEGAEINVLEGARALLEKERPYVILESNLLNLGAHACPPQRLFTFAKELNYRLVSLPGLVPLEREEDFLLHMMITESFLLLPFHS